jgi:hypothetical protein
MKYIQTEMIKIDKNGQWKLIKFTPPPPTPPPTPAAPSGGSEDLSTADAVPMA